MAAAGGGGGAGRRGLLKRKPNFTLQEIDILMSEVLKYEQLLFGAAASTVNAYEKQKIWWRITNKINAAGRNQRDIGEVKNRWRGLRRRANDKITRHRQERQAPAAAAPPRAAAAAAGPRAAPGPGPGPGPGWALRAAAGLEPPLAAVEVVAPHGVKEEAVKEEPVEVKTEPYHAPTSESGHARAAPERRLPRGNAPAPGELREGWSRSPPHPSQPELSGGGGGSEPGGQQEPLGSDFTSIIFEQDAVEHLTNCGVGEPGGAGTVPLSERGPESARLSLAEKRIIQSNEQLVQEVRAFRREYAESRRETASVLRIIAEALSGVSSSLAQIRDLYLREQAAPKP
ncbi:myb-related transcription factor, partner of profilin-like [Apteryx mantelli]|uniref:Myb-related transcription factor, partner of profilin-like n=1 Tax=Apteryx mantelli TaxID=2696672 RepID=A0ABM4FP58_9AVES